MFKLGIAQCFDSVWLKRSTKKPANGTQQKGVGYTVLYTLPSFREKTKSFTHLHRPHAMISGADVHSSFLDPISGMEKRSLHSI
jgi:hypothetical protein